MSAVGAFTFVLHSHLPYARLAGRWPHGEEWIHEAASETYLPLLETLYDLIEEGISFKLTIGITPVLAEQLADPLVLEHLDQYLEAKLAAARKDMWYFEGHSLDDQGALAGSIIVSGERKTVSETRTITQTMQIVQIKPEDEQSPDLSVQAQGIGITNYESPATADAHLRYLAEWYKSYYERVKNAFHKRFNRDIIGAFRKLQDQGYIEIITSAATHGYLPLLSRDSSIFAQIQTGIATHTRLFGRPPTAIWLPECAYRPAYYNARRELRPGLEGFLAEQGIKVFFSETHTIEGGQPVGVAAGDVIGPYGEIKRRYVIPATLASPKRPATTFKSYYVSNSAAGSEAEDHSGVAVIGRNNRTGQQVWSADWGYPGDFDYREFHKKAGTSGLQYWRVTGSRTDLAHKDYYHPEWASYKVDQHAEHFAHLVSDLLRDYHSETGEYGLIASNYDTELFGHWWFEGVAWLGAVIRHLAANPDIDLTTASQLISEHPPTEVLNLPESSWGAGGNHFTWKNGDTNWMWPPIYDAELRMEGLVIRYAQPSEDEEIVLKQIARELLLLQSSDWPFLVTTGQAREYAISRFNQHLERFNRLADTLDSGQPNRVLAEEYYHLDKLFPDVDYRWFHSR